MSSIRGSLMLLRRAAHVMLEPREQIEFDLGDLVAGGDGLGARLEWIAVVPHAAREIPVSPEQAAALGAISPSRWTTRDALESEHAPRVIDALLGHGLLVEQGSDADRRDGIVRDAGWRTASAGLHYASRWRGVDTAEVQRNFTELHGGDLMKQLGPAPPHVRERGDARDRIALPRAPRSALDALLDTRVTCRNFDTAPLREADFAAVLQRAFGARAVDDYAPGLKLLKKGVPSAGGLHPTEAYLLVQHVDGVAPGLYHYHPVDHALEPMRALTADEARTLAKAFVGAQPYFVDAPVLVMPVTRFHRNFWKYRNHPKAYRALVLDVGHLSQTLYLAATELGLAAFITAAINEVDIEEAFGLDPLEEGPLAVCGFGLRAGQRSAFEFDPLHAAWPATG
jgi:putative peptide maturation dehydrogenase